MRTVVAGFLEEILTQRDSPISGKVFDLPAGENSDRNGIEALFMDPVQDCLHEGRARAGGGDGASHFLEKN